jgi:hypothetical protein
MKIIYAAFNAHTVALNFTRNNNKRTDVIIFFSLSRATDGMGEIKDLYAHEVIITTQV